MSLLARSSQLMLARSLMRARREVLIAPPAASALRDDDRLTWPRKVGYQLARLVVIQQRAYRDLKRRVLAGDSRAVRPQPVSPALRLMLRVESEVDQGVVAQRRAHADVAAVT